MAYVNELSGRKLLNKMGGSLNESASAPVSGFAKNMLESMGWKEGEGLGKHGSGIKTHIKAKKREEGQGLGQEKVATAVAGDTWWNSELEKTLYLIKQKKELKKKAEKEAKKAKKSKKEKKSKKGGADGGGSEGSDDGSDGGDSDTGSPVKLDIDESLLLQGFVDKGLPTDAELFNATGGARLGMRAQRRANGKWKRAEGEAIREEEGKVVAEWDGMGKANIVGKKEEKRKRKAEEKEAEEREAKEREAEEKDEKAEEEKAAVVEEDNTSAKKAKKEKTEKNDNKSKKSD
jgi:Pin2-interacting protein X1